MISFKVSYVLLYIVLLFVSLLQLLNAEKNIGELSHFYLDVSNVEMIFVFFVISISFFFAIFLSEIKFFNKLKISKRIKFFVNNKRLHWFLVFIFIAEIGFTLITGVGVVGSNNSHFLSPIFIIISPVFYFPIYYFLYREDSTCRKLFIINVLLFCLFKLSQGWTAFIFQIFMYELYFYMKKTNKFKKYSIVLLLPLVILFLGGVIYKPIYELKMQIRGLGSETITIEESIGHLASRLSILPISVGAIQNKDKVKSLFENESERYGLIETKSLLRPYLPNVFYGEKEHRTLNNIVMYSYYTSINKYTSSNFGGIIYAYLLAHSDIYQFLFYLMFSFICLLITAIVFNSLSQKDNQLNILFFFYCFNFFNNGSLEMIFSYGPLGIMPFIIILLMCRIIKIKVRK
ncbi:TPA: oligosaccharide repeat unit polymerase [Vibrio parahaemolyticus]|nr:oligosaccharide repeat unit polymerase [Vibrio parahaemolyticus]